MNNLLVKKNKEQLMKRMIVAFLFFSSLLVFLFVANDVAFALDPISSLNKLKMFFIDFFKIIGVIVVLVGVAILAMGLSSHDSSQKIQGIITLGAGIMIACAGWFADFLTSE